MHAFWLNSDALLLLHTPLNLGTGSKLISKTGAPELGSQFGILEDENFVNTSAVLDEAALETSESISFEGALRCPTKIVAPGCNSLDLQLLLFSSQLFILSCCLSVDCHCAIHLGLTVNPSDGADSNDSGDEVLATG